MNQIFRKVNEVDPNNSEAVKDVLSTFFQNLIKQADSGSSRWLQTLEIIINRYPKFCGSHRNTIETYLSNFVDSTNYFNVIEAAKCAHALQQVRSPQEKTATAKVSWREHLIVLCNVAHKFIGELFPNSVDMYKGGTNRQKLQLQSTETSQLYSVFTQANSGKPQDNNVNKQHILSTKLKNVFVFLQAMLVEIYPVAKPVQPQLILEVIVRALSVSSGTKTNLDISTIAAIKIQALRTLDALVACLGSNLIPFSPLIFKFVIQTLKWTSDYPSEESRKVRVSAYASVSRWLRTLGTHRLRDDVTRAPDDALVAHALADVTPHRHVVQLTMNSQPTKNLSKKAKRKLANSMLMESSIAAHAPGEKNKIPTSVETNEEVAIAALEFLETFVLVCGIFLKQNTHKLLLERLVRECYNWASYPVERSLPLLRCLEALRKAGPGKAPPPTQHCLQLYSMLLGSGQEQITRFCSEALLDIRLHLHCAPPSLSFALEAQEKEKEPEKRKKISEKNRAALASLLHKENQRIPIEENGPEEIIDISDEPTSKKVRLSTEIDRISVSSDSDDAMVVEDDVMTPEGAEGDNNDSSFEEIEVHDEDVSISNKTENDIKDPEIEEVSVVVSKDVTNGQCGDDIDNALQITETNASAPPIDFNDAVDASPSPSLSGNIHDAKTQMPLNASNDDTVDGDRSPLSMEVSYDFPNTGKDKVTILDKIEDENLPSTNDTDDIQITCGQVVKNSQDIDLEKNKEVGAQEAVEVKVNGAKSPEQNIVSKDLPENKVDKAAQDVNVNDMLADFVDEVVEENISVTK